MPRRPHRHRHGRAADADLERLFDRDDVPGLPARNPRHLHPRRALRRRFHPQNSTAQVFSTTGISIVRKMVESAADFGTGLRAHLGLEQDELELVTAPEAAPEQLAVDEIEDVDDVEADEIARRPRPRRAWRRSRHSRRSCSSASEPLPSARPASPAAPAHCWPRRRLSTTKCSAAAPRPATTSSPACGGGGAWPDGRAHRANQSDRLHRWSIYVATPFVWLALALLNPLLLLIPPMFVFAIWKAMDYGMVDRHDPRRPRLLLAALLFDRDRLREVARLVDVEAAQARDPVGEQLQRDDRRGQPGGSSAFSGRR